MTRSLELICLEELAENRVNEVLRSVVDGGHPLTIVDSPPGAGKTWLIEQLIGLAVLDCHLNVCCIASTNEQVEMLSRRCAESFPIPRHQLLMREGREPSQALGPDIQLIHSATQIGGGPGVVFCTLAKCAASLRHLVDGQFDLMICDEAYQIKFGELNQVTGLCRQLVLVGDPGQLPPIIRAEKTFFEAADVRVHRPAPEEILAVHPDALRVALPATRRLPSDTVRYLQPHMYPDNVFGSLVTEEQSRISFLNKGLPEDAIDRALDLIEDGASLLGLVLPRSKDAFLEVDEELTELMYAVVDRLDRRRACDQDQSLLAPYRIGCIDPHVQSGGALRERLGRRGLGGIRVDTPEIWQGGETDITIVLHPLASCVKPSQFDLEPGRFTVMLSRHKRACILVGREGIDEQFDSYLHDCGVAAYGADDSTWKGFSAHRGIWQQLRGEGRILQIGPSDIRRS